MKSERHERFPEYPALENKMYTTYGSSMGQKIGIAHRRKKTLRKQATLKVWARTTRVWRRRFRGTERGAKWMLWTRQCVDQYIDLGRVEPLLALLPACTSFPSTQQYTVTPSSASLPFSCLLDADQVFSIFVLIPLHNHLTLFRMAIRARGTGFVMHVSPRAP